MSNIIELIENVLSPALDAANRSGNPVIKGAGRATESSLTKVFNAVEPYTKRLPISFASQVTIQAEAQRAFQLGVEVGAEEGATALRRLSQRRPRDVVEAVVERRKNERREHLRVV